MNVTSPMLEIGVACTVIVFTAGAFLILHLLAVLVMKLPARVEVASQKRKARRRVLRRRKARRRVLRRREKMAKSRAKAQAKALDQAIPQQRRFGRKKKVAA